MTERSFQDYIDTVTEALPKVRERIDAAYRSQTRNQGGVTLLAATKTVPVEVINYAIDRLGLRCIGENRVQELLSKYDALHKEGVEIHFIGRLQTNKVKYIIDKVSLIHSVDSLRLAAEIDRQAKKHGKVMAILVEINVGGEDTKGGITPDALPDFLTKLSAFSSLSVKGLMVIPPQNATKEENLNYFNETYQFFVDFFKKKVHNTIDTYFLSMGMSDSYEEAVLSGSNLVRVGSAIFGKRLYPITPNESEG
ncbi:MAG: YggS family pyridoxal phosphate-dependent enzyme [Clostridia bacterium]|nr:YggS family pyridoxal phosphate-dependent enzyme [Clostridia bacterium]